MAYYIYLYYACSVDLPITKPNKYNQSTSCKPITILSTILPYITNNIQHITTQHCYKITHSTIMALHEINNHCTRLQSKATTSTHTVALDMIKAFGIVYIHPYIWILINIIHTHQHTNTITKFIANCKAVSLETKHLHNTNSKLFSMDASFQTNLFNICNSDMPTHPKRTQLVTYADNILLSNLMQCIT